MDSETDVSHFVLTGWTTDGRKWFEVIHFTHELIEWAGIRLIQLVTGYVRSWDERQDCVTRKITFRQLGEVEWAEFNGRWNG